MSSTRTFQPGDLVTHFKRDLQPASVLAQQPELYQYEIIGEATHSETGEALMVYRACYGERKLFVRPLSMFLSPVDQEKYPEARQQYRFEKRERMSPC